MNKSIVFFYIPYPDEISARETGMHLIENKIAACVQYFPVHSNFLWNKQFEKSDEIVLIAKTLKASQKALRKAIRKMHPYELPFIGHFEMQVNKEYYNWARSIVKK
ncbi:MAG: divalent-cation tolerance protein CutA [Saprospiraceae bacterium]|nr:divalent-cation tolerance protein CutA [Saprospiraceae bacterium]